MDPIALVQYRMIYERVIMDWVQYHETLPTVDEAALAISGIAPSGLGKPLHVEVPLDLDAEGCYTAYSRLYWNLLFLEEAIRSALRSWDNSIIGLVSQRNRLQTQIDSLARRIDALVRRGGDVVFSRYDTFDNVTYTDPTSSVLVDVGRGVVTLLTDRQVRVDGFESVRMGSGITLRRSEPAQVGGVRLEVAGNGVVSIRVKTSDGWVDVYRSAFAGTDDVEFGLYTVTEIELQFEGMGRVASAFPYVRQYRSDGDFISTVWSIPSGMRDRLSRYIRVEIDGESPPGTSVVPYVRMVRGTSYGEWQLASKPVPIPIVRTEYELRQWELIEEERIYRSVDSVPLTSMQVFVGEDQWRLDGVPLESDQQDRLNAGKSLMVDESYLSSRVVSGYLRAVPASVRYQSDGSVAAVSLLSGTDVGVCLYLVSGESPTYLLRANRLQPGMLYRLEGYLYSAESVSRVVQMELQGNFAAAMSVNGTQVMSHRIGSSSMSDKKQVSTVSLRSGYNRIVILFAITNNDTDIYLIWSLGPGNVQAFRTPFRECSSHALRVDAGNTDSCYALVSQGDGYKVEMALPMVEVSHGTAKLQPPRVRVVTSQLDEIDGVQVRLALRTENPAKSPVIRSYKLEVLE
jgi:hypothetical protein